MKNNKLKDISRKLSQTFKSLVVGYVSECFAFGFQRIFLIECLDCLIFSRGEVRVLGQLQVTEKWITAD